jgi:hypothetical protein
MAPRMVWNRPRGIITSAIWKMIDRQRRAILAPIFTNRSRSVASDHAVPERTAASSLGPDFRGLDSKVQEGSRAALPRLGFDPGVG